MQLLLLVLIPVFVWGSGLETNATSNSEMESHHILDNGSGIYAPVLVIGGRGGQRYEAYGGTNGKILREISVWFGEWQIKAINITLSDDTPRLFGQTAGRRPSGTFTFEEGETITQLSLWGNGAGTRLGAILFYTNKGKHFGVRMQGWVLRHEYRIDVGSGICVGVILNAGVDIDNAGFVFLNPIQSSKMIGVKYPLFSFNMGEVTSLILETFSTSNPGKWRFGNTYTAQNSQKWSIGSGLERLVSLNYVEGSIPEVGPGHWWKLSAQVQTFGLTSSTAKSLSWDMTGSLAPGKSISLSAAVTRGTVSTPYEGMMRIQMVSGEVFYYPCKGKYDGVSFSSVYLK